MKEVVTFGETMVSFIPENSGPLRHVHGFSKSIAGAESNVAIALARLGHDVGWFSKIGDDEFGEYIKFMIRGEGVDVSRVVKDQNHKTGLMFKERFMHTNPSVYYYRKGSACSYMTENDLDFDYIKDSKILHITGITLALSESARKTVFKAIEVAKESGTLISFDPNIRLKLWDVAVARDVILEVAKHADLILPGVDEAKLLIGTEEPKRIADYFIGLGCKTVVLKLGKQGCYVANASKGKFIKGFPVEQTEDTIGAGDGFAAGFLSGYLREESIEMCGRLGNAVGAMATLVRGDMEGFPSEIQVKMFMGDHEFIDR